MLFYSIADITISFVVLLLFIKQIVENIRFYWKWYLEGNFFVLKQFANLKYKDTTFKWNVMEMIFMKNIIYIFHLNQKHGHDCHNLQLLLKKKLKKK